MTEHIKINDVPSKIQYIGDGVTTEFSYAFAIFAEENMQVYFETILQSSGYTVDGVGETDGGTVTFDAAPTEGVIITLMRSVDIERVTDFQEGGTFRAKNINDDLDRIVAIEQDIQEQVDRSIKVDIISDVEPEELITEIERIYDSIDNVDAVADDISNVNIVADNASNIESCIENMDAIIAAPICANEAANSAEAAAESASSIKLPDNPTVGDYIKYEEGGYVADTQPTTNAENIAINTDNIHYPDGYLYGGDANYDSDKITPNMASSSQDGYIITSSTERTSYENWQAFDGTFTFASSWDSVYGNTSGWLAVELPSSKVVTVYDLTGGIIGTGTNERCPKDWILQGSNDGSNWDDLDTRTDIDDWDGEASSPSDTKQFTFTNSTAYLHYRLNISAINGGTQIDVVELRLYEHVLSSFSVTACKARSSDDTSDINVAAGRLDLEEDSDWASGTVPGELFDAMTSNTTPTGNECWCTTAFSATYAPWKAFNKTTSDINDCTAMTDTTESTPNILLRNMQGLVPIEAIALQSRSNGTDYPEDFTIVYTTDDMSSYSNVDTDLRNINFTTVKTVTGEASTSTELKTYTLDDEIPTDATAWGIYCTAVGGTYMSIQRMEAYAGALENASIYTWAVYDDTTPYFILDDETGSHITALKVKTSFISTDVDGVIDNIVNYSFSRENIINWNLPSIEYINYSFPTNGDVLTAPADGYFITRFLAGAGDDRYFEMVNEQTGIGDNGYIYVNDSVPISCVVEMKKGQTMVVNYTMGIGTISWFRFLYKEGEL